MKEMRIFFFGDSICFGQGVSVHKTWIAKIARTLDKKLSAIGCELLLQNYSINGNTTRMALERIAYDIQSKELDLLVVQFGINDANIWMTDNGNPRVSAESFAANLQEIINRVKSFGVKTVILNTNHLTARTDVLPNSDIVFVEHIRLYNELIRQVAAKNAGFVVLVDMEQHIEAALKTLPEAEKNSYLLPDKVHLSVYGNELYYTGFYPALEKVVEEMLNAGGGA